MRPGITVRPCRSITRVAGPASFCTSAVLPVATIFPSRIAIACRIENWLSTVTTLPLTRTVSGLCAASGAAPNSAQTMSATVVVFIGTRDRRT